MATSTPNTFYHAFRDLVAQHRPTNRDLMETIAMSVGSILNQAIQHHHDPIHILDILFGASIAAMQAIREESPPIVPPNLGDPMSN